MDNVSYISEEFHKGHKVYIIDDWEELAMCYNPQYPEYVFVKKHHKEPRECPASNRIIFEATLNGNIVNEQEFFVY